MRVSPVISVMNGQPRSRGLILISSRMSTPLAPPSEVGSNMSTMTAHSGADRRQESGRKVANMII